MKDNSKKLKTAILVLSVLLVLSAAGLAGLAIRNYMAARGSAEVQDNLISPDENDAPGLWAGIGHPSPRFAPMRVRTRAANGMAAMEPNSDPKAAVISLHEKQPQDNQPFQADNLFPGDAESRRYCVRISHSGDVTVYFHADIRPGYEKLAEVLNCRVVLLTTGETLYEGLMRDMPPSLTHSVKADKNTETELYYEITAYLDTSVGNEYQNKDLVADFRWWVEDIGSLGPPQTGDAFPMALYLGLACGSLIILALLNKRGRKEEAA